MIIFIYVITKIQIRIRMDSYKGMTAEEIKDIFDYQEYQRQENNVEIIIFYLLK